MRLARTVAYWRNIYNRRRAIEALISAVCSWVFLGSLLSLSRRVFDLTFSPLLPFAALGAGCLSCATIWLWRRSLDDMQIACLVDDTYQLNDLLSSALAVSQKAEVHDGALRELVMKQAVLRAEELEVGSFGAVQPPLAMLSLALAGLVAASLGQLLITSQPFPSQTLPTPGSALADLRQADEEQAPDAPLPTELASALRQDLERLEQLAALFREDQAIFDNLSRSVEHLLRALEDSLTSLDRVASLSQAERLLQELSTNRQFREQTSQGLSLQPSSTRDSLNQMLNNLRVARSQQLSTLNRERAPSCPPGQGDSQTCRQPGDERAEEHRSRHGLEPSDTLRELLGESTQSAASSTPQDSADDDARADQAPNSWGLGGLSRGPGQGPAPRLFSELLPEMETLPSLWLSSQWEDGSEGLIRLIEGASRGERSALEYLQVLHEYNSVAEAITQREEIPLTRRNYIQRYFEVIRPR